MKQRKRRCAVCHALPHGQDGPGHAAPIGAVREAGNGYLVVKLSSARWMLQHRHVMEQKLGRSLASEEIVHHLDGDPGNNAPDNLVLTAGLRDHLDTYHKDNLKPPPVHHNGRRRKDGTMPMGLKYRKRSDAGKPRKRMEATI